MKQSTLLLILILLALIGCNRETEQQNIFSSSNDTLILKTEKVKGFGMFPAGAGQIHFKDTIEQYEYPVIFPKNISEIKLAVQHVDIKPFQYQNLKKSYSDYMTTFLDENFPEKFDTLNIASIKENTICIMSGKLDNEKIFIVDENNNKDFRDDSVRTWRKMDWHTKEQLIKCKYKVFGEGKMQLDSTWVNIGTSRGDNLLFFVSHHIVSEFSIEEDKYQLGITDEQSNFCFDNPILALISKNGVMKDSLLKSELLSKGEYLKLENNYYKFEDISNDGKYITLVKEKNFNSQIGTQIGMLAPTFNVITTKGDTLKSLNLNSKVMIIANSCGCGGDEESTGAYYDIKRTFKNTNILHVDSKIKTNLDGLHIDTENTFNKDFYHKYRKEYCSRICYVIGTDNRIIDKFNITNWKKFLPKLIEK